MGKNPALTGKRKPSKQGIEALRKYRDLRRDDMFYASKSIFLDEDECRAGE